MNRRVFVRGTGTVLVRDAGDVLGLAPRLAEAASPIELRGHRVRLVHRIEEVAFLAAAEALAGGGRPFPVGETGTGIILGIDEGIDDIKADHWRAVLAEGPLGASPLHFPFTAPNAVTAQLTIFLDLRGETATVCGGALSGAEAIGLAAASVRDGRFDSMLAGGATSIGKKLVRGIESACGRHAGEPRDGAGILLLDAEGVDGAAAGEILGYGEGRGAGRVAAAVSRCLAEAKTGPGSLSEVFCAGGDPREIVAGVRQTGFQGRFSRASSADMHSAAFPLAVAGALREPEAAEGEFLVVAADCLGGAASLLVRRGILEEKGRM